jgi:hypothetical protein
MVLGRPVLIAAALTVASLAVAQPAAAEYATVTVPPSGSTVAIPGPFDEFGGFTGPYFPISWGCGDSWELTIFTDPSGGPVTGPSGFMSSAEVPFNPLWRNRLLITGSRDSLPYPVRVYGSFRCFDPSVPAWIETPFSTDVIYAEATTGGVIPPGAPPGTAPTTPPYVAANAARVRAFKQAKQVLERDRKKMLDAVEQLEEQNEVFCSVAGSLSALRGLHAFQWNGTHIVKHTVLEEFDIHHVCEALPAGVKIIFDADRKIDRNRKLIERLDGEIKSLELSSGLAAGASAKPRGPLSTLENKGELALTAMDALTTAIEKGNLDDARRHAQSAATQLAAVSASCNEVKSYLRKSGLGKRFTRPRILKALRGLSASKLSRSTAAFAKALHIRTAQMKRLIRRAKSVPKAHVKAMAVSDLFCSAKLDEIDRSLTGTLTTFAAGL